MSQEPRKRDEWWQRMMGRHSDFIDDSLSKLWQERQAIIAESDIISFGDFDREADTPMIVAAPNDPASS